jgi:hypothetical protein
MAHATDRQLQAHLQGTLVADEERALAEHLQGCADCQQRLAALEGVWGPLGTWTVPAVPGDLKARIMEALPESTEAGRGRTWRQSMRVAAALLVAAGIGHAAGRLAWKPTTTPAPNAEAVAEALHLDDPTTATMLLAALDAPDGGQQ